ncbi:hypothetical protein EDD15DRAFT_2362878 [Pisolithus albus]|nr:hypothetical protein EDD15DRAFT_2362878 [Pisolithus albus]
MPPKQHLPAGRREASEAAAGNRPHSTRNPLPSIPETSILTEPEDAQGDDSAVGVHSPRRHSQQSNAGTGGRLQQLEKVSQAIETPCRQREQVIDLPNDKPVNVMAPTLHCRRKNGGPKYRSQADSEGSTAVPASARHGWVIQPSQVSVQAEQDTRFGFQLGPPCRPTFVGPQSHDAFQGHQMNSAVTTNKGKGSRVLPFDLAEATFLAPFEADSYSTTDLIANRARQLQKRPNDLATIHDRVLKARFASAKDFAACFEKTIHDFDFEPGALVLVRNSRIEKELDRKTKPCYLGPMVVVRRTKGSSYLLAELDGAISKFRFATFRLFPYFPRNKSRIEVTQLVGLDNAAIDRLEDDSLPDPDLTGVLRDESDE